jgi:hypothetical protein
VQFRFAMFTTAPATNLRQLGRSRSPRTFLANRIQEPTQENSHRISYSSALSLKGSCELTSTKLTSYGNKKQRDPRRACGTPTRKTLYPNPPHRRKSRKTSANLGVGPGVHAKPAPVHIATNSGLLRNTFKMLCSDDSTRIERISTKAQ